MFKFMMRVLYTVAEEKRKTLSGHILSFLRLALKRTVPQLIAPGDVISRKKLIFAYAGMYPPEFNTLGLIFFYSASRGVKVSLFTWTNIWVNVNHFFNLSSLFVDVILF